VLAQCVEVDLVDVPRMAGQQVREAKDCSLGGVEEFLVPPGAWLTQPSDLLLSDASPLRRSGV